MVSRFTYACQAWYERPHMSTNAAIRKLKRLCKDRAQAEVARELGVSKQYLGDVLLGRSEPGPLILDALGLERKVIYCDVNR